MFWEGEAPAEPRAALSSTIGLTLSRVPLALPVPVERCN